MFKKIIIILFLSSPLFFLFIGYPVTLSKQRQHQAALTTQRCFHIGNTKEFFSCFQNHERKSGILLVSQVIFEINDLQSGMGYAFILFFIAQYFLLLLLVGRKQKLFE